MNLKAYIKHIVIIILLSMILLSISGCSSNREIVKDSGIYYEGSTPVGYTCSSGSCTL